MKYNWRRKEEQANHVDDWLMTYADMITLLLCFFVIFLSVSIPHKGTAQKVQLPQPVPQPVRAEPAPPPIKLMDIPEGDLPFHSLEQADQSTDTVTDAPPAEPIDKPAEPIKQPDATLPPLSDISAAAPATGASAISLPVADSAVADKPSLPEIVDHLKSMGPADIEQKGDRITTLAVSSAAFFDSGSSTLSIAGKTILHAVAANIQSDKFKNYQVTVEGHTDDTPIKTLQFPSNWELSTARAAAVVHFFIDQGVPAQRLRAAGYADTFPIAPNRDEAGKSIPENQARNRRVVIKLEKIEKTE